MNYDSITSEILTLGTPRIDSPIPKNGRIYVDDDERIFIDVSVNGVMASINDKRNVSSFELAGPRRTIYFDPSKLRCAIVTCGGLCPGLNAVIRSIVFELSFRYGVKNIYGIKYGLQGFIPKYQHDVIELNPSTVSNIIRKGGTFLGSSRGPQDIDEIIDSLDRMNIGALFMIGGDGTLVAASKIADAIMARGLNISVTGIPKTIDNDIFLVSQSFGFDTAVELATHSIRAGHNEATGYPNGIGLIKLMGRHSGFIAATAALAHQDVNFVLIPEVDFDLEGSLGLLSALEKRLEERGHAVIIVAEGAGGKFFKDQESYFDPSGNVKLNDIGLFLRDKIPEYFKTKGVGISMKYIDPSYLIRSLPANSNDQVFCNFLGRNAVHAAMAGKTKLLVGYWNNQFVHVPMSASAGKRKQVDPQGKLWLGVLDATGQGPLKNI